MGEGAPNVNLKKKIGVRYQMTMTFLAEYVNRDEMTQNEGLHKLLNPRRSLAEDLFLDTPEAESKKGLTPTKMYIATCKSILNSYTRQYTSTQITK